MSENTCTHAYIKNTFTDPATLIADACAHVAKEGVCGYNLINFTEFAYCDIRYMAIFLLLVCVFIFLIFKYTSIVVEDYIAEGITKISDALKLSEALAAVTLLALANGAGDVITAIVAGGEEGGVSYNIGALYGAGLFVASMVVGISMVNSKEVMIYDKMIIYRDIGFYILSTVVILVFALISNIEWWSAVILLLIYVAMVLVVYFMEKCQKKKNRYSY